MLRTGAISLAALAMIAMAASPGGAAEVRTFGNIIGELVPITGDEGNPGKAAIDLDIRFEINSATLSPDATRQLDELGKALTSPQLATAKIEINGHTDASGDAVYNKKLSQKRADAVKGYLVKVYRINEGRLSAIGWGEEQLKNAKSPKAADNRRVEIVNLTPPKPPAKVVTPPPPAVPTTTSVPVQQSVPVQPSVPSVPSIQSQPAAPAQPEPAQGIGGTQNDSGLQIIN
jgi:hypothetical protein